MELSEIGNGNKEQVMHVQILLVVLIVGAVFVSTRRMVTTRRSTPAWRVQAEKDIRAMLGEETPEELRELMTEERYTQESNHAACEFWGDAMLHDDRR
jgi:hypothetical protein